MKAIFTGIDGELNGIHYQQSVFSDPSKDGYDIDESKLPLLKEICDATGAKVVLSSAKKIGWNLYNGEITEEDEQNPTNPYFIRLLADFKRYGIPYYGKTPVIPKQLGPSTYVDTWKEYEILAYLGAHPEIDYYCVLESYREDLTSLEDHVVQTYDYTPDGQGEGLQPRHKEEIMRVLQRKYR